MYSIRFLSTALISSVVLSCGVIIGLEKEYPSSDAGTEDMGGEGYRVDRGPEIVEEGPDQVEVGPEPGDGDSDAADTDEDACEVCSLYCNVDSDCDDHNACNGVETCDAATTHMCLPGTFAAAGTTCNDGLFCTSSDTCDGEGRCMGVGNPCDDGRECTSDGCLEGADRYVCSTTVIEGTCFIDDQCTSDGEERSDNPCQVCNSAVENTAWSPALDMAVCGSGVCCGGVCRSGGSCCADTDCPIACVGSPAPCTNFSNETACMSQTGCAWVAFLALCFGTHADCSTYADEAECNAQSGCVWGHRSCADNTCL